jgi:hypothetical protein
MPRGRPIGAVVAWPEPRGHAAPVVDLTADAVTLTEGQPSNTIVVRRASAAGDAQREPDAFASRLQRHRPNGFLRRLLG